MSPFHSVEIRGILSHTFLAFGVGHFVFVGDGQILANYQWNNYGNDNKHMYSDQNFNLTLQQ